MKYLCLIYIDEGTLDRLPPEAFAAVEAACLEYEEYLKGSRTLLAAEALEPTRSATTVRIRNGRTSISDGPFDATHEQLAGYFLIEARDLNDAIRVAGGIPPARFGSVEVRPVRAVPGISDHAYRSGADLLSPHPAGPSPARTGKV